MKSFLVILLNLPVFSNQGYKTLRKYVANNALLNISDITASDVNQYMSKHTSEFDTSRSYDSDDTSIEGEGNDIMIITSEGVKLFTEYGVILDDVYDSNNYATIIAGLFNNRVLVVDII
ncbi:hypothetical protein [Shewanella woodyi]|uniref:hypothetical protein n=1 Tax=Shewanella woodyi TaxID=60961 RepID=UPI00374927D2